jgi:hypothetical protein
MSTYIEVEEHQSFLNGFNIDMGYNFDTMRLKDVTMDRPMASFAQNAYMQNITPIKPCMPYFPPIKSTNG